jgi:hypothetical protein
MHTLELGDRRIGLGDGPVRNVGASNETGSAKLFDVENVSARAFGDEHVKLVFQDETGSEVQVALVPDDIESLLDDLETIRNDTEVFDWHPRL